MNSTPIYLHLHTLTAPKTSQNAQGGIVYAILKDETVPIVSEHFGGYVVHQRPASALACLFDN